MKVVGDCMPPWERFSFFSAEKSRYHNEVRSCVLSAESYIGYMSSHDMMFAGDEITSFESVLVFKGCIETIYSDS